VISLGAPMDVLWMRISKQPDDPQQTLGRADNGHILVMLGRGDYWQCGFVIPKGSSTQREQAGLALLRDQIRHLAPFLGDRVNELRDWNDVKLLTVAVDRLGRWYRPGLLCIGDAAHAMSPIGGVGINLAIQDAVAAANIVAPAFHDTGVGVQHLLKVQRRRELPTRITQTVQVFLQNRVIRGVLQDQKPIGNRLPFVLKLLQRWPALQRIPARLIGIGFRPEHVQIQDRLGERTQSGKHGSAAGSSTRLARGK
jgi:2-polyprenyl-6-methoxyphenol hydroxylase-like FAD-dependent oxidoreductase